MTVKKERKCLWQQVYPLDKKPIKGIAPVTAKTANRKALTSLLKLRFRAVWVDES